MLKPNNFPDELRLSAWRTFITANARLIDRIDRELTAADRLPLWWYDILVELVEASDNRLRMHDLAERVVLSRSGLTRLVDKLEEVGLLRREPDLADRRGAFAVLTPKGREAIRKSWPTYANGITLHFAQHLSDAEAKTLAEVFTRLIDALKAESHSE